jgi:hypothetical protein
MARLPLTLRALLLVPLLAVSVDQARATLACGPRAESCLQAAGQGWLGPVGMALLLAYAIALALGVAGLARGAEHRRAPGIARLWALGSAGVAAVCGGQALLAGALGAGAALGGGWIELAVLCVVAGGLLALALRVAPAASELARSLRPRAPRPVAGPPAVLLLLARGGRRASAPVGPPARGRAPPLGLG